MAVKKTPRFGKEPESVGGIRIQPRDIEIIRLAYEYRLLDSKQIQALLDSSNQGILRRLKKLHHHDYLDRPKSQFALAEPLSGGINLVYALGDKGADLLAEKFGIDRGKIKWKKKNEKVKERHIKHTLMISDFRTCLSVALKNVPETELLFWTRENPQELKDYVRFKERGIRGRQRRLTVVPDGFFAIQDPGDPEYQMHFFLEADRSTMTNTRFKNKMRAYWLMWYQTEKEGRKNRFGVESFRVLTITKSERRKENLRKVAKEADDKHIGSGIFWFATEKNYQIEKPATILRKIWQTPRDDKWHSILEQEFS